MLDGQTPWQRALRNVLAEFRDHEVQWGKYDCMQLVARYVSAVTGIEYADRFDYDSEQGANALIESHGGLVGLISGCIGDPHDDPQPGDVVVAHAADFHTGGIFVGTYLWGMHPMKGICRYAGSRVVAAWSI